MGCIWCDKDEKFNKTVKLVKQMEHGALYIHRDQTHRGRCIYAYKNHSQKITELGRAEYLAVMSEVYSAIDAITRAFNPGKVNLLILGDVSKHLHIHLCPKNTDEKDWGVPFNVDEQVEQYVSEDELDSRIKKIRENL